jgi:signal transduction histidine kinase
MAVPAYLQSIALNFITNAIKYRHPDRPAIVSIDAKKMDKWIILSVADNGIGIDLEQHGHKLFGMYKTFHGNSDARGIGLFITKNQIEAMGGKVEVESTAGFGTKFNIYFHENN